MASATNAKGGDSRRLRAALDECGLSLLAQKFAEHGVDDSCLSAIEDEDLEAMGIEPASRSTILAVCAPFMIARLNRALLCLELGRLAATTAAGAA